MAPARQKTRGEGALRHRERQLPVRHTFSLSQRTLLFSRCALWGTNRGPRARGRCSVTHAPSFLRITYLYLEPVRARRATRDRPPIDRCICTILSAFVHARARANTRLEECDRAPIEGGPTLDSLIDCTHAEPNPLRNQSRVFRMVTDAPVSAVSAEISRSD